MSIAPAQCRAGRALIGWSQDQLSTAAKVAKATIANFEAGRRAPYERTLDDIRAALEQAGVEFIAENGGGGGVRLKQRSARLLRRDDVPEKSWVAFAFDYRGRRHLGFVRYDVFEAMDDPSPIEAFDRLNGQLLKAAVSKLDRGDLDDLGRVHINVSDFASS